jgi:hypothetical protein
MVESAMKKTKNKITRIALAVMICALILFCACEDVININLNEADQRIVIEGRVSNRLPSYSVKITRSTDYFNPGDFETVSDAIVIITDDAGNADTLQELPIGEYNAYWRVGVPGRTYTLTVSIDGETYTGSSTMIEPIEIDSLTYEYQEGGGIGMDEDEGYRLHCFFTDRADIDDYCMLRVYRNRGRLQRYFLYDGQWSDGNPIDYEYFEKVFNLGDTMTVDLLTLNEQDFDYFELLRQVIADGNEGQANPTNPISNLSNRALGYFAAYSINTASIIIE